VFTQAICGTLNCFCNTSTTAPPGAEIGQINLPHEIFCRFIIMLPSEIAQMGPASSFAEFLTFPAAVISCPP